MADSDKMLKWLVSLVQGGMTFNFHTQSDKGAILVLPRGADSWEIQKRSELEEYVTKNGRSWYDFVNNGPEHYRREVPNGTLGLVTKVVKTSDFGVASFENASQAVGVSFSLKAASAIAGQASASFKWETSASIGHHSGPKRIPVTVGSFALAVYIYDLISVTGK